jgi:HEAT repeat protein
MASKQTKGDSKVIWIVAGIAVLLAGVGLIYKYTGNAPAPTGAGQPTAYDTLKKQDLASLAKQAQDSRKDLLTALAAVQALGDIAREDPAKAAEVAGILDEIVGTTEADPGVRGNAADVLGEIALVLKPDVPWAGLTKAAGDASAPAAVRAQALQALGNIPRGGIVEPLLNGLIDDDVSVREAAFASWVKVSGSRPVAESGETASGLMIAVQDAYHPVSNPNKAYVDAQKVNLVNWKNLLNAKDRPTGR